MRRGPSGRSPWRNDNSRQFRPKTGNPNIRLRALLQPPYFDLPRFPASAHGFRGPRPGLNHNNSNNNNQFLNRIINERKSWNKHPNQGPPDHRNNQKFYDNQNTPHDVYNTNKYGDVDQRITPFMTQQNSQDNQRPYISPWAFDTDERPNSSFNKNTGGPSRPYNRYYDEPHPDLQMGTRGLPVPDNIGHRPPASDYYDSVPGAAIDESNSFSRSVDDTVDIVRKKLMSRNDPQSHQNPPFTHENDNSAPIQSSESDHYQHINAESSSGKKKKQRRTMQQNCDTIKNKIVHQLFKMDKGKIHKLMDNPNSSTKFEYAINSLITESQNSFNRHMRSAAEKSLCGSKSINIEYEDTDTIYEDTFMRQMQCILDPQDTVFLEDIKPIVMAELNKVLQLDGHIELPYEQPIDEMSYGGREGSYKNKDYITGDTYYNKDHQSSYYEGYYPNEYDEPDYNNAQNEDVVVEPQETKVYDNNPLYKRRPAPKSTDCVESSFDVNKLSSDVDKPTSSRKIQERCQTPVNFFDASVEPLSDEEDQFAELDKQYHVAVGLNFIGSEEPRTPNDDYQNSMSSQPEENKYRPIKNEPDADINKEAMSSGIDATVNELRSNILSMINQNSKEAEKSTRKCSKDKVSVKKEPEDTEVKDHIPKHKSDSHQMDKSYYHRSSRKRSSSQKPSHRKEKRKKTESPPDTNNQILNKNIIINLNNDCKKSSENCDSKSKSVVNLYFSKQKTDKEVVEKKDKKNIDTNYSDKYVKRKDSTEHKDKGQSSEVRNRNNSVSSNHSLQSPTDISLSTTPVKSDIKLKPIDIFTEVSNRKANVHQAHRNTAISGTPNKTEEKVKTIPPKVLSKQVTRRHVGSQTISKPFTKGTQTIGKRLVNSTTQTNPTSSEKTSHKSNDPFERMKQIDLEIQELVQEKFKLYNSIESKESSNSMQNLGMTVLSMVPDNNKDNDEISISEDAIIDNFTNIPEDELAQIAMETVNDESIRTSSKSWRSRKPETKIKQYKSTKSKKMVKPKENVKTPNISLLEQIITDDRPLEDIISLDDLEESPNKTHSSKKKTKSKKNISKHQKKKTDKASTPQVTINPYEAYGIKRCYVLLTRIDKECEKLLNKPKEGIVIKLKKLDKENQFEIQQQTSKTKNEENLRTESVVEEDVVEDCQVAFSLDANEAIIDSISFHDDMWDVSEDIVIGADDEKKDVTVPIPIPEEVLDNSQSESEDAENTSSSPECKLYDFSSKESVGNDILAVTGNVDAVLALELVENNFLAACLDGNVYHFNGEGQLLATLRGSNLAVTCLNIVKTKSETVVYTGSLDSRIRCYDLETGAEKGPECNVLSAIQTMDRAWDTIFVGTRTGFVLQFECKSNMLIPVSTVKFSDQSILALRALKEGPRKVLLVACRSESVTIKDALTGLLLRTLEAPKMTVYTLLFEDGKVYCGTSSNQIQVFDYSSGTHIGEHEGGKGAVCLRAAGGLLFAGCYDGCVYVFRPGEPSPFAQLRGPNVMLLSLAVNGSRIIAGYKDRSLFVWKIPVGILKEMVL